MLLFIYNTFLTFGIIFCLSLAFFMWRKRSLFLSKPPMHKNGKWCLPIEVTAHELGRIEGENPLLKEVIIVANKIEEPQNGLLKAVKSNFKKNICYTFFISHTTFESELKRYIRVFQGLAQAADQDSKNIVKVHHLTIEWEDVPYIFYRAKKSLESEDVFIFGYRGDQQAEGIANNYTLMGPKQAYTIFNLISGYTKNKSLSTMTPNAFVTGQTDSTSTESILSMAEQTSAKGPLQ